MNTFIVDLLKGKEIKKEQLEFLKINVDKFFKDSNPSNNIIKEITKELINLYYHLLSIGFYEKSYNLRSL